MYPFCATVELKFRDNTELVQWVVRENYNKAIVGLEANNVEFKTMV